MVDVVVAHSIDPDAQEALAELLDQLAPQLTHSPWDQHPVQAGLLFVSSYVNPEPLLRGLSSAFPGIALAGCSSDGELSSTLGYGENSAVLVLFCAPQLHFATRLCRPLSQGIASALPAGGLTHQDQSPSLCFAFSDSLTSNGDEVIQILRQRLPGCAIFGGLAADQWQFEQTWQWTDDGVVDDGLAMLLCYGALSLSSASASGWQPQGRRGRVTRADGNKVQAIDDRPAMEFYIDALGGWPGIMGQYPLAIRQQAQPLLRAPLAGDPPSGQLTFAGNVPQGSEVQIATTTSAAILNAVTGATREAVDGFAGEPALALIISCTARHVMLGSQTRREAALAKAQLPPGLPFVGLYCYGEFAPLVSGGEGAVLHNETYVCLLLGEAKTDE